jgi:hypothetical protein
MAVGENSREHYLGAYRKHVKPVFGDRTLAQVARDRDGVLDLLTVTMKDLSDTLRQQARMIRSSSERAKKPSKPTSSPSTF